MKHGIEKYAVLTMECGEKKQMRKGIEQPNEEKITTLREKETYKYLGILGTDTIKHEE